MAPNLGVATQRGSHRCSEVFGKQYPLHAVKPYSLVTQSLRHHCPVLQRVVVACAVREKLIRVIVKKVRIIQYPQAI